MANSPRAALLYSPITDPTSGYHPLVYLDSFARSKGHPAADLIDVNIEAFHHSLTPSATDWLARQLRERRAGAADLPPITAAHLLPVGDPDPEATRRSVALLQDPERFYDPGAYHHAVATVIAWMNALGAAGSPGQFQEGFRLLMPPKMIMGQLSALTDERQIATLNRPFEPYYQDVLAPRLASGGYGVIGINITYVYQLPFALWLLRLARKAAPDAFIVVGGTEVSDDWKYLKDKSRMFELFADADAAVVGEGETAYVDILDAVADGRLPGSHPNIRLHPRYGIGRALPVLYEPIRELPTPDYGGLPWDLYLSPERFVYYAPSRGCYWNKCTFCDYGLNDGSPTSPWRQDTVDLMIRDVTEISKFATFVYFSVDVLAPATILRFAEQVVERGIQVKWGAEIRLEKYWSPDRCDLLRRSGCTAISVGMESGSQRILDLINKGTRPDQVKRTMTAMTGAGIGVQVMGFTGFPTETVEEAGDSIDFLVDNKDLWTFGGLGEFVLTSGAIAARQPERFGISDVQPMPGADICRALTYTEPVTDAAREQVAEMKARLPDSNSRDRPWLGSTDTPHSFFYHDRYGPAVRDLLTGHASLRPGDHATRFARNGEFVERPSDEVLREYNQQYPIYQGKTPPPGRGVFRRTDGRIFLTARTSTSVLEMLDRPHTLDELAGPLWMLAPAARDALWDLLIFRRMIRRLAPTPAAVARVPQEVPA